MPDCDQVIRLFHFQSPSTPTLSWVWINLLSWFLFQSPSTPTLPWIVLCLSQSLIWKKNGRIPILCFGINCRRGMDRFGKLFLFFKRSFRFFRLDSPSSRSSLSGVCIGRHCLMLNWLSHVIILIPPNRNRNHLCSC